MKGLLALGMLMMGSLIGCGDKGGSGDVTVTPPITSSSYYYVDRGICYNDSQAPVDISNCAGLSGYYQVNNYCYNPQNVKVVNDYCLRNPSRIRPSCEGSGFYTMRRGKKVPFECRDRRCQGRRVYERDNRMSLCRA